MYEVVTVYRNRSDRAYAKISTLMTVFSFEISTDDQVNVITHKCAQLLAVHIRSCIAGLYRSYAYYKIN